MKTRRWIHTALSTAAIGAGLVLGTATANAQEATPDVGMEVASSKTRADVMREIEQARRDGTIHAGNVGYDFSGRMASTASRAEVQAQAVAARESGEIAAMNGEAGDVSMHASRPAPSNTLTVAARR